MSIVNEIKVDFLSVPENEGFARLTISAFLLPLNPTMSELSDVKTAVSEAVTNAIIHGYQGKLGTVRMRATLTDKRFLTVDITDNGVGIPISSRRCSRSGRAWTASSAAAWASR